MNTIELKSYWNEHKEKLKQKFESLADYDLMYEEGKKEEILRKLQQRLGKTKAEVIKIIEGL